MIKAVDGVGISLSDAVFFDISTAFGYNIVEYE